MLMRLLPRVGSRARDERGFTLIEALVAILTGVVVTGALFAILEVSLHQTSLITDKVQADQLGRTAMTKLVEELHSACISTGFTPVEAESNENQLIFINAHGTGATISKATEHQVIWNASAGTLTDFRYPSKEESGSEWPNFKFPALNYSSTTHLASNAVPTTGVQLGSNLSQSGSTPVFQYYKYATESSSAEANRALGTLNPTPLTVPLTSETAAEAASVLVSFRAAASDGYTANNRRVDLSDQVTFALGAPSNETPIEDTPCH